MSKSPITRKTTCPKCNREQFTGSPNCLCGFCLARWKIDWEMTPEEFWSINSAPKSQKTIKKLADTLQIDFKALNILFNTQWEMDGKEGRWVQFSQVPEQDLEYAKSKGLFKEPIELNHQSMITQVIQAREQISRRDVAAAFASSLITQRLDLRSTLGSYAHALHLPAHPFDSTKPEESCRVCKFSESETIPVNHYFFRRMMWAGNVYQGDFGYVLCDLKAFDNSNIDCGKKEKSLLKKLFSTIRELPENAGLSELEKSLTELFPSNKQERQVVLEILGYCGIIKPSNCPSMHQQWIPRCEMPVPSHFYTKEWKSPVNCWTGADGINDEAIDYWFGDL